MKRVTRRGFGRRAGNKWLRCVPSAPPPPTAHPGAAIILGFYASVAATFTRARLRRKCSQSSRMFSRKRLAFAINNGACVGARARKWRPLCCWRVVVVAAVGRAPGKFGRNWNSRVVARSKSRRSLSLPSTSAESARHSKDSTSRSFRPSHFGASLVISTDVQAAERAEAIRTDSPERSARVS